MDHITEIKLNHNLIYGRFININNKFYIQYRHDKNKSNFYENNKEIIKIVKLNKINEINYLNIDLDIKSANHNLQIYNINDRIIGIGGQCIPKIRYETDFYNQYKNFLNEYTIERKINICNCKNLDECNLCILEKKKCFFYNQEIRHDLLSLIDPYIECPFYANGTYIFYFKDQYLNKLNDFESKLILNGFKKNRHDGHYGHHAINGSMKNGITVYDSNNSLVFNHEKNMYYLYVRANLGLGLRFIQYCTSTNLKNWSNFNLIKFDTIQDLSNINIYFSNFFYNKDLKIYFGLLGMGLNNKLKIPYNKKSNPCIDLNLYISNDGIEWNYRVTLKEIEYHNEYPIFGDFIKYNDKYLIYIQNFKEKKINIYSLSKLFLKDICNTNISILHLYEKYNILKNIYNKINYVNKQLHQKQNIIDVLKIYIKLNKSSNNHIKYIKKIIYEQNNIDCNNDEENKILKTNIDDFYINDEIEFNNKSLEILKNILKDKYNKLKIKDNIINIKFNKLKKIKKN